MNETAFRMILAREHTSIPKIADKTGICRKSMYAKLKNGKFNQKEILALKFALNLTDTDILNVFFNWMFLLGHK